MTSVIIDRNAGLSSAAAIKGPCLVATTANITLAGEQTIDQVACVTGNRVMVKNQTDARFNGLYVVDTGDWTRCKDFSRNDDVVKGTRVAVTDGSQAGLYQVTFDGTLAIDTTEISFEVAPEQIVLGYLTPEAYGAQGDGTTIDDDALTAWVTACNSTGLTARGTPGKIYRCSSALTLTVRVPFQGNGCIFTVPNNGQAHNSLFDIESLAADIDNSITLGAVNTWTGLQKGSRRIPQLTEKDWAYSFNSADQFILQRSTAGSLNYGEAFATVTDDGWLDAPLARTYTTPFSDLTIVRRKIRAAMVVEGLTIEVVEGSSSLANRIVRTLRPNTIMRNCHIFNVSGDLVQQGFVADSTVGVKYEHCSVSGLGIDSQEYGWNSNYSNRISYMDCWQSDCRRGTDGHASKNVYVGRCNLPDGTGGHWIDGFTVEDSILGFRSAQNPRSIQISGSNILALNNQYHLGTTGQAFCMRSDFPEITGYCILRGGVIHIYDEGDTPIPAGDILVMQLQAYDSYNSLRTVYQPSYLEFTPDLVRQYGAASTNDINLVNVGCPKTAANFPRSVDTSGRMLIAPGKLDFDAGDLNGALPRAYVAFYKGETQIGTPNQVLVKNIPCVYIFSSPFSAAATGANGRYDITVEDATKVSTFDMRVGATRIGRLRRCHTGSTLNRAGAVAALGDEAIDHEDYGAAHLGLCINPFGGVIQRGNGITVADGAYGADGWIGLNETGNTTFAVAANVADNLPFQMRWTQPDVSSKKVGAVCFIGSTESVALRSRLVTLMANLRSTASITARYAILEWIGTANAPTRDVVNDWSSGSFTAGGFFVAANFNVLTTGSVALTANTNKITDPLYAHVGSSCNNLAIAFWTDTALATNGYLQLAADLYPGFERPLTRRRGVTEELHRCGAFYQSKPIRAINGKIFVHTTPVMVKTPTAAATVGTTSANVTNHGVLLTHTVDDVASTVTFAGDI